MPPEPSDHELLLQLTWELKQIREQLGVVLKQLSRGNQRFEQIGLKEQEVSISLVSLRNDFSRSALSAESAQKVSGDALAVAKAVSRDLQDHLDDLRPIIEEFKERGRKIQDLQNDLTRWKNNLKMVGIILAPVQIVLLAIAIEAIKRFLFGP